MRSSSWTGPSARCARCRSGVGPRFWPWPTWGGRPPETPPVPDGLDWDLWLGPAPERPYHPAYCPWTWRNWWDFGTGLLGDLGCHKLSTVFKALKLAHPTSVEASSTLNDSEIYPLGVIARFEFPARGDMPPLTLTWYDGGLKPARPKELEPGRSCRRRDLHRRQGDAHGAPPDPRVEDEELRPAAQEAAALPGPLQGMGRRLPRRPARPAPTSSITPACSPRPACWATSPCGPARSSTGTAPT